MRAAVYCGTRNVYKDMIPSMKSLLIHSNVEKIYFLIEDDIFPYQLPREVQCINVSNQQWFKPDSLNMKNRCSYMVLLRVVFSQIFPHLDRILTIDNDTIVRENVSQLWDLNMQDYYIAGCMEPEQSSPNLTYINMGVAMINLKKWREDGLSTQLVQKLNTYYFYQTQQDAINIACQQHILVLDSMYNRNNYTNLTIGKEKIIHYARVKDWQNLPLVKKYQNIDIQRNKKDIFSLDIIIPHYNNIKGLKDTLQSLDYNIAKVTVVDDCSPNQIELNKLKNIFPRVNFIRLNHNSGPGAARQKGIDSTNGTYIMFIDAGDCVTSQKMLKKAFQSLQKYSQANVFCFNWWNEDGDRIFQKDLVLLQGKIFNREFIELYNFHFNCDPKCSYSNEDRGFMAPCRIMLDYMKTYDKNQRIYFSQNILYNRFLDANSITQADNGAFYYFKHIPGFVYNIEHIVNICNKNKINFYTTMIFTTECLMQLYKCYLQCLKANRGDMENNLNAIKYFYKNIYKRYEYVNGNVLQQYYTQYAPSLIKNTSARAPRINIKRFINEIKN